MKYAPHDDEPGAPARGLVPTPPNEPKPSGLTEALYKRCAVEHDVLTAYAVRLYRELDRSQGGTVARTIMRDLLAEVPSVAESLTRREQEQIEKAEGWK